MKNFKRRPFQAGFGVLALRLSIKHLRYDFLGEAYFKITYFFINLNKAIKKQRHYQHVENKFSTLMKSIYKHYFQKTTCINLLFIFKDSKLKHE